MLPPRAYYFFGLNAVRALSIISLILVFSSSILLMVNNIKAVNAFHAESAEDAAANAMEDCDYIEGSTVPHQPAGVFWAVVSSLLIIFQVIILFLSEMNWPAVFFDTWFPVLGANFGLGALGIFQCLIGAQILSHHVDEFSLVSAFFLFSIGCLNMLLGLIFRESAKTKRSIRAWRSDAKGILPTASDNRPVFVNASPQFVPALFNGDHHSNEEKARPAEEFGTNSWMTTGGGDPRAGYGFGRQGEKAAGLRGFLLQPPPESLPRYAPPPSRVSLARTASNRSSTSSFASPSQPVSPLYPEHDEQGAPSHPPGLDVSRSGTPQPNFQSSRTAL